MLNTIFNSFLGKAPVWYKASILLFLAINPLIYFYLDFMGLNPGFILGWIVLIQFIFTLVFSIQCYPLQPGGLIAFQALLLGLTDAYHVLHEIETNLEVILLLVFMVSAIFFMKNLLMVAAFLSAFLDALTVTAVLITVMVGFYHVFANSLKNNEITTKEFEQVKSFLVDIMMHGAVGTALGGVCTIVGEPQNLLIADKAGWEFMEFFYRMAPVTMPVLVAGLICCVLIEKFKVFDYGHQMSDELRNKIIINAEKVDANRTEMEKLHLVMEGILGLCLIFALGLHLAPVGIIGLFLMVFLTAFKGITEEHQLGGAFEESLPFTALLVIFFVVVAVINDQSLFTPVINVVLASSLDMQVPLFYLANGALSVISDNVFVATVYMNEIVLALENNVITKEQFDRLAVAINTGTNLPSVATPNGQAAFLFLLTSSLAPLIGLSYLKMVYKALPYTIVLTLVGLACVIYFI